jgi:hypothetical protein
MDGLWSPTELIMTIPPLVLKNQTIENPIYYWLPSITPVV